MNSPQYTTVGQKKLKPCELLIDNCVNKKPKKPMVVGMNSPRYRN